MRLSENKHIRDKTCDRARDELGILSIKLQLRYDAGWPDAMFLVPGGRPVLMEFKLPGKELEPLQVYRRNVLKKLGYDVVGPITSVEQGLKHLRKRLR